MKRNRHRAYDSKKQVEWSRMKNLVFHILPTYDSKEVTKEGNMELDFLVTQVLHRLGICRTFHGFSYIAYAMTLIRKDKDYLCYVTKSLYIDIAKEFATTPTCVEKNIRTIVNKIWEKSEANQKYIIEIFGEVYLVQKPANAEFLELLYDYVASCNIVKTHLDISCPVTNTTCVLSYQCTRFDIQK